MRRLQKVVFVISVITILVLVTLLGIFLLQENNSTKDDKVSFEELFPGEEEFVSNLQEESEGTKEGVSQKREETKEEVSENEIENDEQNQQETEPVKDVTMIFTGDVLLGNSAGGKYANEGISGILSETLRQEMLQADIAMINQEFPFSTRGTPMPDKQYTFRVNPAYIRAFADMGVDVVSLANNHALDYGTEALQDTFSTLEQAGIPYVGAGDTKERAAQPTFIKCGERTVGFLAASRVIPVVSWNIENQQPGLLCTYDSTALVEAIEETRKNCDYLVVYVHWGIEHQKYPEEYQRSLAQAYIEAGADLVVGSHPHVPQGIEYYEGKPIIYSLGNFIFNPEMNGTYILKVLWQASGETQLSVIPIDAVNSFTSEMQGEQSQEMLRYIEEISFDVAIDVDGKVTDISQ